MLYKPPDSLFSSEIILIQDNYHNDCDEPLGGRKERDPQPTLLFPSPPITVSHIE